MKKQVMITITLVMLVLQLNMVSTAAGYSNVLQPTDYGNTLITWSVIDAPETAFGWWGLDYTPHGNWLAEDNSKMTFEVTSIGDSNAYLTGVLTLGNLTMTTNNTDIGYNLVLGLSGLMTWYPGVAIPTGASSIEAQNQTAYVAAERVAGNWLNGSIDAWYENIPVGGTQYECIVWDFAQDATGYGQPQLTTLAYDIETGVLVQSNSTYTFDEPYILVLELESIQVPQPPIDLGLIAIISGILVVALIVVVVVKRK